jgi:hypothetical protein
MDYFHRVFWVYEDVSSPGNRFHAWAKFPKYPDRETRVNINGSWVDSSCGGDPNYDCGATVIRCEFQETGDRFGGFVFLNGLLEGNDRTPSFNFGTALNAGVDLTGATALKFWARGERGGEVIDFFMGGVGRSESGVVNRPCTPAFPGQCPAPDSTPAVKISNIMLKKEWTEYTIPLTGKNLTYVLGGFGWGASAVENRTGAIFYLDNIRYELNVARRSQRLNEPRLLRSFSTLPVQPPDMEDSNKEDDVDLGIRNTAFVYDNALALLAFLADNSEDSVRRARLIGDALVYVFNHDRKGDGIGLRSMYAAGDISLPPGWTPNGRQGTAPASGYYDETRQKFVELEENRSIDIGNQAWAMLALEALHQHTKNPAYLEAAKEIGAVIKRYRQNTGTYRGFRRGVDEVDLLTLDEIKQGVGLNKDNVRKGASAEHNLDIYAAFSTIFQLTGDPQWQADAEHAKKLVEAMWDDEIGCYWAGTADPENIYKPPLADHPGVIPVDVQAWTVMAIPGTLKLHPQVLASAEQNHRNSHHGFLGFDFNNDRDGVWFEGTAHMAVAYALAGLSADAAIIRAELGKAQLPESYLDRPADPKRDPFDAKLGGGKGTPASCHDELSTGFDPPPDPVTGKKIFHYHRRLHVGATAWNVFAQLRVNPYYLVSTPFDVVLQDDRSGDVLRFNSSSGEYQFLRCGADGFTISGVGQVRRTGCLLILENSQVSALVDRCLIAPQNRGSASIHRTPLGPVYLIEDRDITNNLGRCP